MGKRDKVKPSQVKATKKSEEEEKKQIQKSIGVNVEEIEEPVQPVQEEPDSDDDLSESVEEEERQKVKSSRVRDIQQNIDHLEASDRATGVVYLGHLPWGFDESGIKKYFEQFGKITRILVPRSKQTGRVKGYAFVEFEDKGVAQIAAKTMNNYILFEKVLKCSLVEDVAKHDLIFKRWKRKFKYHDKYQNYLKEKNKIKTKEELKETVKLLLEKEELKRKKLTEMGIKYDYPGYSALIEKHRASKENKPTKAAKATKPTKATESDNKKEKTVKDKKKSVKR